MLAALGMFVFATDTALFDQLSRERDWRHADTERFGARAASQFLGPGGDKITLSGTLVPELAGSYSAIETLAEMADTGDGHQLADGTGTLYGTFTIRRLSEQHSAIIDNGKARVIGFTLELARSD
jgi:phage protein U